MCWEDVRIHRSARMLTKAQTVPAASTEILPQNPNRVAIVIGFVGTNPLHFINDPAVSATFGMRQNITSIPLVLNMRDYGAAIQDTWFGFGVGGNSVCTITEIFLTRKKEQIVDV